MHIAAMRGHIYAAVAQLCYKRSVAEVRHVVPCMRQAAMVRGCQPPQQFRFVRPSDCQAGNKEFVGYIRKATSFP